MNSREKRLADLESRLRPDDMTLLAQLEAGPDTTTAYLELLGLTGSADPVVAARAEEILRLRGCGETVDFMRMLA